MDGFAWVLGCDLVRHLVGSGGQATGEEQHKRLRLFRNEDVALGLWLHPVQRTTVHHVRFMKELDAAASSGATRAWLRSFEDPDSARYPIAASPVTPEQMLLFEK